MTNVDYMQYNNGNITMFCDQLPDKGFIDVIKVRNICIARIMSVKIKKANNIGTGPDVEITQASGEKTYITRKELTSNFRHCNGKPIKVLYLRSNCKYYVISESGQGDRYKAIKLPDNCRGTLRGSTVQSGNYLIGKEGPDGSIDRNTLTVVSAKMFRKSFKIPMQSVIKRHIYNAPNTKFGLYDSDRIAELRGCKKQHSVQEVEKSYTQPTQQPHSISLGTGLNQAMNRNIDKSDIKPKQVSMPSQNTIKMPNMSKPVAQTQQQNIGQSLKSHYKYTVTHRIVGATSPALLGYVVKEISTGVTKQLNTQQVMQLCEKKLVDNISLVQRENGIKFLKGNNIRIESLPQIIG